MKPTVGKIAKQLLEKPKDNIHIIDQQRKMQEGYIKDLIDAVERGKKKYINSDFFVDVITKKEPLMENVLRSYFVDRKTCPTPNYDQAVYRYVHSQEQVEFVWVIPDRETCFMLRQNALIIAPEERDLLKFVLDYDNGTLFKLCKKFNGEELESPLLKEGK
jgi:hypothetical protein